jgi:hypothetical protein
MIQIDDPYVPDAEGELVRADFTVRDVVASADPPSPSAM